MNKPFDLKDLVARMKVSGLNVAEDVAKAVVPQILDWAQESFAMHPNAIVKMGAALVMGVRDTIVKELDKIDGQVG